MLEASGYTISARMSEFEETKEALLARHKKEQRDLVARTTGMRKQASKKTRKRVRKQIEELETELKRKQAEELEKFEAEHGEVDQKSESVQEATKGETVTPEMLLAQLEIEEKEKREEIAKEEAAKKQKQDQQKVPHKHRNRQRERLERRKAEMKKQEEQARKEAANMPSAKEVEEQAIKKLCEEQNLVPHEITPDGHCLFASIADQLKTRQEVDMSVKELRAKAADYIKANEEVFQPFLFDQNTNSMQNVEEYANKVENTALWGGDIEILALSKIFDSPVRILMAGRKPMVVNEEGQQPELKIVYYQHKLGLGEHYNSLRDVVGEEKKDEWNE